METMPHCDQRVLHPPGECEYCDAYPEWQALRQTWGVAFTGQEPRLDQVQCPSTVVRTIDVINMWPGNQPGNGR